MPQTRRKELLVTWIRMMVDLCWLLTAYALSTLIMAPPGLSWTRSLLAHQWYFFAMAGVWCLMAMDQRLFVSRRNQSLLSVVFDVTRAYLATSVLAVFLLELSMRYQFERGFMALFAVLGLAAGLAFNLLGRPALWSFRRHGFNFRRILLVGANERARHVAEVLLANEQYGYAIEGFLDDDPERGAVLAPYRLPHLGGIAELENLLVNRVIDSVYICLPVRSSYETIMNIAHLCEGVGVQVRLVADLFPLRLVSSNVTWIGGLPFLSLEENPELKTWFALKRAGVLVVGLLLLVFLAPLFLLIAAAVRLESAGPAFVRHPQVGRGRKPFHALAFRVKKADGSVSRVGALLHSSGLETLPHLINIVLGQMPESGASIARLDEEEDDATPAREASPIPTPETPPRQHASVWHLLHPDLLGFAFVDSMCILLAYLAAIYLVVPVQEVMRLTVENNVPYLAVFLCVWYSAAVDRRLWQTRATVGMHTYLSAVVKTVGYATVLCVAVMALLVPEGVSRRFLVTFCITAGLSVVTFRLLLHWTLSYVRGMGYRLRKTVVVGANERTKQLLENIGRHKRFGYALQGVLDDDPERAASLGDQELPHLGTPKQLIALIDEGRVEEVFITLPLQSHYQTILTLIRHCEAKDIPVHILADLLPLYIASSRVMLLEDIPLVSLSPISEAYTALAVKRLMDFLGSTVLILVFSPILIGAALVVKFDSPGPIFFFQERIGQNGRRFRMIKYRSMVVNAEALRKELEALNEADGPVFKIRKDPRITRSGRFMRKYSVDELPQLFNVWMGQMSLVGPRPPILSEVVQYTWSQRRRLSVRPGMTGLWQVSGRSNVGFQEWVELDLKYIDNWSLGLDFIILLKTFKAVVAGRGAS